jgi:hypothetical protein
VRTIFRGRCVASCEWAYSPMSSRHEPTAFCRDISGDAVFVSQVREYRDKPWVNRTMVPYTPTSDLPHPHPHPDSPARPLFALECPLRCAPLSLMPGHLNMPRRARSADARESRHMCKSRFSMSDD